MADTPQLQELLEDLTDPSATISEGNENSEEDTIAENIQHTRHLGRGISSAVLDEEAQLSPTISIKPLERPMHIVERTREPLVRRTGLSVKHRSAPSRMADTPQLQASPENLVFPLATIFEGDKNSKENTVAANVQRTRHLARWIAAL